MESPKVLDIASVLAYIGVMEAKMSEMTTQGGMAVYRLDTGRYIVARWDQRNAQYVGHAVPTPTTGYVYSYGRSLVALASVGVPTYATRRSAFAALRRRYQD